MTRRRRPKCGLSGSAAEHAVEFQNARHEALDAIHDASQAMRKQKCLIAGKRIDDGYVAIGKMQATAQTGEELAETSRVHAALEKADNPFETSCVREEPIRAVAGLGAVEAPKTFVVRGASHALVMTNPHFVEHTSGRRIEFIRFAVGENPKLGLDTVEILVQLAPEAGKKQPLQVWYGVPADELFEAVSTTGSFRDLVGIGRADREAVLVWLDQMRTAGRLQGLPAAALVAASIPMGIPGVPFVGLGATPEELDAAAQRWAAQHGTEEYEADEGDAEAAAKTFKPKTKEELDLFRQQLDAQEAEEKARGKKDPHPPTGPAAPFRKEMMGTPASSTRIYNVTLSGKKGVALKRRVREYPRELHDGTRVFRLDSADEDDGTVVYIETTGQAQQVAPAKAAPRRVMVRAKPKADVPQVDPFAPLPPVPEAIAPAPAPAPIAPVPSAQASAEEQWLAERARMKAPAKEPVKNLISAAQLAPYQYARNESDHMLEVLFRIPGVEGLSPAETILKSQLAVARMPETLTVDGVVLTRGMLQSLPGGQPVVSYRAFKEAGAFVPHFPTPDQRAANDALLNYQSLFAAKQANILPAGEWTEETSRARLVFKPEALARINIFNPDAPRSFHAPEKLELFHGKRREHVRVEMKAFGKGMAFEVPIAKLRENPAQWPAGRYTVQVGFEPAQAIAVWLAKSANAGLGAMALVDAVYHPRFSAFGPVDFGEGTFITPSTTFPTSWPALASVDFHAVRLPAGRFADWLAVSFNFDRHSDHRPPRSTRFESQPNVSVDAMLPLSRARHERVWALTDWQSNQTVTIELTDKVYAEFQVWLDAALSEPL